MQATKSNNINSFSPRTVWPSSVRVTKDEECVAYCRELKKDQLAHSGMLKGTLYLHNKAYYCEIYTFRMPFTSQILQPWPWHLCERS